VRCNIIGYTWFKFLDFVAVNKDLHDASQKVRWIRKGTGVSKHCDICLPGIHEGVVIPNFLYHCSRSVTGFSFWYRM
jgi:hypothetical protein